MEQVLDCRIHLRDALLYSSCILALAGQSGLNICEAGMQEVGVVVDGGEFRVDGVLHSVHRAFELEVDTGTGALDVPVDPVQRFGGIGRESG